MIRFSGYGRHGVSSAPDRAHREYTDRYRFMKEWFPKEVKEKQKENAEEIAGEQMGVVHQDPGCLIM